MNKKTLIIFLSAFFFSIAIFPGCQSTQLKDTIQRDLDDLQKQIFELQQDQAYINTKVEQVSEELSPLHEGMEAQRTQIQEAMARQSELDKNIKMINERLFAQEKDPKVSDDSHAYTEEQKQLYLSPRKLYDSALDFIRSEKMDPAIALLNQYLDLYPRTELADNAQYWLGECYYKKGDFNKAIQEFKKVLADYPEGNKIPSALLKIGYAHYELQQIPLALESLQKIIKEYSNDSTYPLAQKKIDLILSER